MPSSSEYQQQALEELVHAEPVFNLVVNEYGAPPLWQREEGFPTLIRVILEQQVSLASGKAAFDKLTEASGVLTPARFLEFDDEELKRIGFSRQKTSYGRDLSEAVLSGELDFKILQSLTDDEVRTSLTTIKGIGVWTANIYLLMALQRTDIWPKGDIALAAAYQQLKVLDKRPTNDEMEDFSAAWRPWRSVAARLLWHYYLSEKTRKAKET